MQIACFLFNHFYNIDMKKKKSPRFLGLLHGATDQLKRQIGKGKRAEHANTIRLSTEHKADREVHSSDHLLAKSAYFNLTGFKSTTELRPHCLDNLQCGFSVGLCRPASRKIRAGGKGRWRRAIILS